MAPKFAAPGTRAASPSDRVVDNESGDVARQLWNALNDARAANMPSTRAHLEDAIFGHYLPWVRTLAQQERQWIADAVATEQAAELGLAQALLAWHHRISDGFIDFAEVSIRSQLRRLESGNCADAPTIMATAKNLGFASTIE